MKQEAKTIEEGVKAMLEKHQPTEVDTIQLDLLGKKASHIME